MQGSSYKTYCDILEVTPDATLREIKKSYLYLKELYSSNTIASIPLDDEFSEFDKKKILAKIDNAYHELMVLMKQDRDLPDIEDGKPGDHEDVAKFISEIDTYSGPALRQIREKMGISLESIARDTKIQIQNLSNLEFEKFENLPPEVYTRGFVASYAESLSLDPKRVVDDYMRLYREWKADHRKGTVASLFSIFKIKK